MPDKNINIDTDVILRYLEKTASPEEIRQLREWIALSEYRRVSLWLTCLYKTLG